MFLGQEVHYYMVYIAYYTKLNLQLCNYAQMRRKNSQYAPDESFVAIFALANFCHPVSQCTQVHLSIVVGLKSLLSKYTPPLIFCPPKPLSLQTPLSSLARLLKVIKHSQNPHSVKEKPMFKDDDSELNNHSMMLLKGYWLSVGNGKFPF